MAIHLRFDDRNLTIDLMSLCWRPQHAGKQLSQTRKICPVMTVFFQAFEEKMRSLQQDMLNPQFTNGIVLLPVDIMQMMLTLTCDRVH